jgi:uncharacterized membrane protein YbhN (UPF0104 family)
VPYLTNYMPETVPQKGTKTARLLKLLLKIVISGACIWYVSTKIDFARAGAAIRGADWFYLFLALLAFILSKVFSSIRLNIYFRDTGIHLPEWQNMKLYWMGMFYNLFLPGSISGDAYKVVLVSDKFNTSYKKTTSAVLLDRFSGLFGLGLLLAVYTAFVLQNRLYIIAVWLGISISLLVFYLVIKRYLKHFHSSFFITLFWALMVQGSQVVCAYLIMAAMGIPAHVTEYIFIFLVSSVVSVLPLTIGGLGARELVFLKGSAYFGLVQETSVVISILFYLITLLTSVVGLYYVFNNPLKR